MQSEFSFASNRCTIKKFEDLTIIQMIFWWLSKPVTIVIDAFHHQPVIFSVNEIILWVSFRMLA